MKFIEVKCIQPFFDEVWYNNKPFEIRINDRNYEVGDIVWQREYEPDVNEYPGRSVIQEITKMLIPENTFDGLTKDRCLFYTKELTRRVEHPSTKGGESR